MTDLMPHIAGLSVFIIGMIIAVKRYMGVR